MPEDNDARLVGMASGGALDYDEDGNRMMLMLLQRSLLFLQWSLLVFYKSVYTFRYYSRCTNMYCTSKQESKFFSFT